MSHTPGPWKLAGRIRIESVPESTTHPFGAFIADLKTHRPGSADRVPDSLTQAANARLITAAPALVAALTNAEIEITNIHRDMLARDEHCPTGCPCTEDSGEACPAATVLNEIEAALTLAKGE